MSSRSKVVAYLPDEEYDKLEELAKKKRINVSTLLEIAISDYEREKRRDKL